MGRDADDSVRLLWPPVLSFLLTLITTTVFGSALAGSFQSGRVLDDGHLLLSYHWLLHGDLRLLNGVAYSVPLLLILLAHELGHYVFCLRWNVRATLPFFGPSPMLLGTIGAFIFIRSPIYSRRSLFDIGISGPLCGFAVLLPVLIAGVWLSHLSGSVEPSYILGTPLLLSALEHLRFGSVPAAQICLHPIAVAAWAGLMATAMNLLPVGQLDGGHILYALCGATWHAIVSYTVIGLLLLAGFVYWPWWLWAVILLFLRRRPAIYNSQPLDRRRRLLGILACLILALSFAPVPVRVA